MRARHAKHPARLKGEMHHSSHHARRRGGGVHHGEGEKSKERHDRPARKLGGGTHKFRTPSGGVSAHARRQAQKKHETMPGGGFPIRNRKDLMNAKHSVGRAKNPAAARSWINKRARELHAPPLGGKKK
jgi:hypothetical protein